MTTADQRPVPATPADTVAAPAAADGARSRPPETAAPEAPAAPSSPAAGGGESPLRTAVSVLTTLGPPLTIATALMLYFGWERSAAQARLMGLNESLFGFSTRDYVLRSISTLYVPLLAVAALALAWLALHQRVERALQRPSSRPALRRAGRAATVTGLLMVAGAVLSAILTRNQNPTPMVEPLVLAAGTATAAYGGWLAGVAGDPGTPSLAAPPWQRALRVLLVGSVITLSLFWEMSSFAAVVGRGQALEIARTISRYPRATAYSATPLGIQAPGVREERVAAGPGSKEAASYRTTGLRFLARSGGRMFLLHDGWTPRRGTVIVLPDNEQVRWQFSR
jgi:hypothetical protein